jgi:hypothetical protein
MSDQARSRDLALLPLGFVAWALGFSVLYGAHALGCDAGWDRTPLGPTSLLRVALVLLWLAFLAATAIPAAITLRRIAARPRMMKLAAAGTSLAAIAAMALTGAPVIALRLCH